MSRSKNFFHAVWSGHILTILTSVTNLITIPIGLAFLGKDGFGLWNAVAQVILFAGFLDLGMGNSLSRFLIDYKDDHTNPAYGNFLKSVFFVGFLQCLLFFALAFALIPYIPDLMGVAAKQKNLFINLLFWQMAPTALAFALRPFGLLLYAHQQMAKLNGCSFVAVLANTVTLIVGLNTGFGIYAYVMAAWATFLVMQAGILFYVWRLHLLPSMRESRISLKMLKPLASYSSNIFLIVLGLKLIEFTPALLVTRHLGISALTDWTIGTRLILFVSQLADRISGSAEPAFWEMFQRKETTRLRQRWLDLVLLAGSFGALLAGGAVAINPTFVEVWTSSRVSWKTSADIFLMAWIVLRVASNCLGMTPGITKRLGIMKFVYFSEGAILMAIVYLPFTHLQTYWQIALILLLGLSLFRLPYGLFRTKRDLEISMPELLKTLGRVLGIAFFLLLLALGLRTATGSLDLIPQLIANSVTYGVAGAAAVYLVGLPPEIRERIRGIYYRLLRRENVIPPGPPHKGVHTDRQ
jgi:O-antigen/teichoic acid export membrane protein